MQKKLGGSKQDVARKAFLIARSIRRRGTRPRPYLTPAVTQNAAAIQDAFAAEIRREVERINRRPR